LLRRRRRSIGVMVRDDGTIEVRAPLRATRREIDAVLERHRAWLLERQREHTQRWRRRLARHFDDGDQVPYLGRQLRLCVLVSASRAVRVAPALLDDALTVWIAANLDVGQRRAASRESVGRWLLAQAGHVFHERHVAMSRRVGVAAVSVVIKDMRSRWGSCGPTRRMSLNWRLVLAPLEIIDYVLVHELTHIEHPDHSPRFWAAVARACPEWKTSRDWLQDHGADLEI